MLLLLAIAGCSTSAPNRDGAMSDDTNDGYEDSGDSMMDDGMMDDSMMEGDKVTFVLTGENFKFVRDGVDNPDLVVNEGDVVRIEFTSTSGFHDFVIDEMGEATERVDSGETSSIEFVANKKGEFEYYCSVGSHREKGMKGKFIVN